MRTLRRKGHIRDARWLPLVALVLIGAAPGVGCGGRGDGPAIQVDSPSAGATAKTSGPRGSTVTISFRVEGFTLAKPGTCGGKPGCGQVYVFVDGKACGNPALVAWQSPVEIDLGSCGRVEGKHMITLALHEEAPPRGAPPKVPFEVTFPIQVEAGTVRPPGCSGSCAPRIAIVFPTAGQECRADGHDKTFPVVVQVENATLAPRGACKGVSGPCGHLELIVDGGACGAPNAFSTTTSFLARFGQCKHANGPHVLTCELRDDGGRLLAAAPPIQIEVKHEDEGDGEDDD